MRSSKEVLTFEGVVSGNVIWMCFFLTYKGKFSFFVAFGLTLASLMEWRGQREISKYFMETPKCIVSVGKLFVYRIQECKQFWLVNCLSVSHWDMLGEPFQIPLACDNKSLQLTTTANPSHYDATWATKLHCKLPLIYTSRSSISHRLSIFIEFLEEPFVAQLHARQVIECLRVLKTIETACTNIRFRLKRKSATISFLFESLGNANQKKYQKFLHSIFELMMCPITDNKF